jgi:hypothetical protein
VDLKVMDLQVCAVNKIPRLRHLRKKADRVCAQWTVAALVMDSCDFEL